MFGLVWLGTVNKAACLNPKRKKMKNAIFGTARNGAISQRKTQHTKRKRNT